MIIVEFCELGSLEAYIKRNRFIDQVDRYTDEIDSTISDLSDSNSSSQNRFVERFDFQSESAINL